MREGKRGEEGERKEGQERRGREEGERRDGGRHKGREPVNAGTKPQYINNKRPLDYKIPQTGKKSIASTYNELTGARTQILNCQVLILMEGHVNSSSVTP